MEISVAHLIIMLATIFLVLFIGLWAARSVHSAEGFSLGGRSAGVTMVAGSIAGTCVGGGATVGTAQLAASFGLSAWWFTIGTGFSLLLLAVFYARPLRKTALITIPQYLAANYGRRAEILATIASSLGIFFSAVASSLPGIALLSAILNIPTWLAAVLLIGVVAAYVFFGGMKTAGVGGILKMLIIWFGLFVAGGLAFWDIHTDPAIAMALNDVKWFDLFSPGGTSIVSNLLSVIVGMLCTQSYIQAVFSAANPRTAAVGALAAALVVLPVGLPCAMIGMYMHVVAPDTLPILVLPTYLFSHQSALLGGIAMGGIVLSLIGSIGGLSLGVSTMITQDIIANRFKINSSQVLLRVNRLVLLVFLLIATVFSIANEGSQVLFWNYLSMGLRGCGVFLPLTLAVFLPHYVGRNWAVASILLGTASALVALLVNSSVPPLFIGLGCSTALIIPGLIYHQK